MPNAARSDADCIQGAYEDAVAGIFKQLLTNLVQQPDGPGDQRYVTMFTTGYDAAKHARTLALAVVGPSAPMAVASAMKTRSASKRKRR